jgi:hypothetical protein
MLAVLWAILPLALAVAVSFIQPMFLDRYLIVVLPALAVVAAAVLTHLRPRPLAIAAVAGLCALHVPGIREWYGSEVNEDWRGAADRIGPRAAAQEMVFTDPPWGAPALAWYLGREVSREPAQSVEAIITPTGALPGPGSVGSVDSVENLNAIEGEILAATPRIWVVVDSEQSGHYEAPIRETFGERPVLERWYAHKLRVTLLGPLRSQAQSSSSTTIP